MYKGFITNLGSTCSSCTPCPETGDESWLVLLVVHRRPQLECLCAGQGCHVDLLAGNSNAIGRTPGD
jgi:hypothetical protein